MAVPSAPRPPNIVLILIDDMGWADLGCYGSSFYETPRLDRLAAEGVRFTDAYASCPVCSPTRASIMTGRYPARVGVTQFINGQSEGRLCDVPYLHFLPMAEFSVAEALRRAGYQTWHVGKWHLGERPGPTGHGFDVNIGGGAWGSPRTYFSPYGGIPSMTDGPTGEYLTDRLTDEAIGLIRAAGDRPFFLNLWHYAVHTPIQSPPALVAKYAAKARALGLDPKADLVEGEPFPCLHKKNLRVVRRQRQSDPAYAAMMENLDTNIGRLLDALAETGQADNTLVVFTSDNGGLATSEGSPTCNAPMAEGKGWMYEGGNRVCLLARWPGVTTAGATCAVPVTSTDFFPTFLEAARQPLMPAEHCDGVSLLPLLRGGDRLAREAIFWHYPHYSNQGDTPACAVRAGDWKLVEWFEDGRQALYNLRDDVSETRNRAADEPVRVQELHDRLAAWMKEVQALRPRPNPRYAELFGPPAGGDPAHV